MFLNPHTITIVQSLPFVHLVFFFKNQNLVWIYEGPCIGSLKGAKLPGEVNAVTFVYGAYVNHAELPEPIYGGYIKQLMGWGFDLKFPSYSNYLNKSYGVYRVLSELKIHMLEWFSTLQVLRYTYESPHIINKWYEWTLKWPHFDPWILFMIVHRGHTGHSLISPMFADYVNPKTVLNQLRRDTEHVLPWDCKLLYPSETLGTLFSKWGGHNGAGYYSLPLPWDAVDVEKEYKALDAQKQGVENADESPVAGPAHPAG